LRVDPGMGKAYFVLHNTFYTFCTLRATWECALLCC
jgi:hypothetical protein